MLIAPAIAVSIAVSIGAGLAGCTDGESARVRDTGAASGSADRPIDPALRIVDGAFTHEAQTIDLGPLQRGVNGLVRIPLVNAGRESRRVVGVQTTCSCAAVVAEEMVLGPGASTAVEVRVRPSSGRTLQATVVVLLDGDGMIRIPLTSSIVEGLPVLSLPREIRLDWEHRFDLPIVVIAAAAPQSASFAVEPRSRIATNVNSAPWRRLGDAPPVDQSPSDQSRINTSRVDSAGTASAESVPLAVWSTRIQGQVVGLGVFGILVVDVEGYESARILLVPQCDDESRAHVSDGPMKALSAVSAAERTGRQP